MGDRVVRVESDDMVGGKKCEGNFNLDNLDVVLCVELRCICVFKWACDFIIWYLFFMVNLV